MNISRSRGYLSAIVVSALSAASVFAVAPAANAQHPASRVAFVSASAAAHSSTQAHRQSCYNAQFTSVQAAIEAVAEGGTVVVCKGTYPGGITVDRRVNLVGRAGAMIDATGLAYGIGVTASHVTVAHLHVANASDTTNGPADGIITAGFAASGPVAADHVRIIGNTVTGNLGSGIDINSSSYSVAVGNIAKDNGIGINVSDDLGPTASHNWIAYNVANRNFGGCGIALADHTGAGINDNYIGFNIANDNGLSTPTAPDASAGSGIILASPVPGGIVRDNTITHNQFAGNGHGGVVVHAHVPGSDFSGNVVSQNKIGTNNLRTDTSDLETTGIYLGSASPMSITITRNVIGPDYYGIFTAGTVTISGKNRYHHVAVPVGHVDTY